MMFWYLPLMVGFTGVLFFYGIFHLLFLRNKRLEKRMKHYLKHAESGKKLDKQKLKALVDIRLARKNIAQKFMSNKKSNQLEELLKSSGIPIKPEEYIFFQWISTALAGLLLYIVSGDIWIGIIGIPIGYMFPKWYVKRKQRNRVNAFNEGLPDMITTLIGSLRAGFSLPQSLQTVVEEGESPIKEEMEQVLREMQYGSSLEDALNGLYNRMPSQDLELMIQAILIQRQVGGNLATVLDKIVQTIRDRTKIQRQITTLTAQGRLSGIVIGVMPIILTLVLYIIQPSYIGTLFKNPIGLILVGVGLVSAVIGFVLIKKVTTIEV